MIQNLSIENLADYVGKEVTLRGWLYNKRSSGKLIFLLLRDGTGLLQCVVFKGNLSEDLFNSADSLTQESSFEVTGTVKKDDRAVGGFELDVSDLKIISLAQEYPITPKEHGVEFLID